MIGKWVIGFWGKAEFGIRIFGRTAMLSPGAITVPHAPYRLTRREKGDCYIEERTLLCKKINKHTVFYFTEAGLSFTIVTALFLLLLLLLFVVIVLWFLLLQLLLLFHIDNLITFWDEAEISRGGLDWTAEHCGGTVLEGGAWLGSTTHWEDGHC